MNSVAKIAGTGERIATYDVSDQQMAVGSTLGGPKATTIIKASGAIEKIYSSDAGETMIGTIVLQHWDEESGISLSNLPGSFHIHPDRQDHLFALSNGIEIHEWLFILSGKMPHEELDPPAAYYQLELHNPTQQSVKLGTYAFAQLSGSLGCDIEVRYDRRRHAFVVKNRSKPDLVRLFGATTKPASYEVSDDHGMATMPSAPGTLRNETVAAGADPLGILHFSNVLPPGGTARICLKVSFAVDGEDQALRNYDAAPEPFDAMKQTRDHYSRALDRAVLISPDSEVNRGVLWAKANMLRVQLFAPTGWCFVNDPTRSNNSVARDTAWFGMGADYIMPRFARESLLWYIDHLEQSGMVVEYYDVRTGEPADYKLNINDDTPLIILALWHHYNTTGDREFLEHVYPKALRAARYILAQRNHQGLVWCTADGTADWGIVGWRNVIEGYRLSGATTELNSECYAAMTTISQMADALGIEEESAEFAGHAKTLRAAINEHLFDRDRNLYYLNIDIDGTVRTDVTGDLVFPVMFGVAEDDVAAHIISRLSVDSFWTGGGIRTIPRNAPMYGPTHGYGLLGGVWVNVTFWFAMAAARFNPEFMAYALSSSFKYYSEDPRRNNTVPGQFSEWLHGETLVNQGMMLSPWFPPHYLWAAIEGAAGLNLAGEKPSLTPRLSPNWKWLGVRKVLLRGQMITWIIARLPELRMYSNFPFDHTLKNSVYESDETEKARISGEAAAPIVLRRGSDLLLFVGNTAERTITTALRLDMDLEGEYRARIFNSLRGQWIDARVRASDLKRGIPLHLDHKGFCLMDLSK